jgi:SAM-dependent methyltransferase
MLRALAARRFSSALDVGCGDGSFLRALRRARPDIASVAGADLSATQIERNRVRFPDIEFHVLDVERATLGRRFDLVTASELVEHVDDQGAAVEHLGAMVNEGGYLLVTCPTGPIHSTEKHFGHVRHPSKAELSALGARAGLHVVSLASWGWPTYRLLKWATNVDPAWALKRFAGGKYSLSAKLVSHGLHLANYLNFADHPRGCQLIALFRRETRR